MTDRGAPLILFGSVRSDGHTARAVERLRSRLEQSDQLNLCALQVGPFDYSQVDRDDGFSTIVDAMLRAPAIVFATPVYWYAMSGPMKTVFDRFTDLLLDPRNRRRGRALAGRDVWLLACGTDPDLPPSVVDPFRLTAAYFDLIWRGACYVPCHPTLGPADDALARVDGFAAAMSA